MKKPRMTPQRSAVIARYEPTPKEKAVLKTYFARRDARVPAPVLKITEKDGRAEMRPDHPSLEVGTDGWREPRTLEEAHTLLASAKILRVHGEAATRASWLDLAAEQEAAVARFLALPEDVVPEVGAGRELVPTPANESAPGLRDTVCNPDKTTALASAERLKLASNAHSLELAVDMAETINAGNSFERSLAHQMAVAHRMAMELIAQAREEMAAYRRSDHLSPHRSIEGARMASTAARLMETFQRGLLTLDRLRNGGRQVVQVQHVTVGDGGQAVVAGTIHPAGRGKRGVKA